MVTMLGAVVLAIAMPVLLLAMAAAVGSVQAGTDCRAMPGYNPNGPNDAWRYPQGTWAGQCHEVKLQTASAYGMIPLGGTIGIAIAAVLAVARRM